MSLAADMLGMSAGSTVPLSGASPRPSGPTVSTPTRPPGASPPPSHSNVPRELAQLKSEFSWGGTTPMAPMAQMAPFKAKRIKAVSWKCLPIRSSARTAMTGKSTDDLDLKHWVKIHNVPDYRFARFNKQIKLLEYSNVEYEQYLHDPEWSREETDRLIELAKKRDLRFIIMEDEYNAMSAQAAIRAKEESIPPIDLDRLKIAEKLLTTKPHAGESKEEVEDRIKATENAVTISANTTMSVPSTDTAMTDVAPPTATVPTDGVPAPVIGDGIIIPPPTASTSQPTFPELYNPPSPRAGPKPVGVFQERTVEQLKTRFYFIQQTLTALRNSSDPDLRKTNPLFTHPYDANHELLRKAQLERLYQRKNDEVDDMAQIVLEHRDISAQIKKIKKAEKENRDALRGYKSGTKRPTTGAAPGGPPGAPGSALLTNSKKKAGQKVPRLPIVLGDLAPLPPQCDASNVLPPRANGTVYLRSAQLAHPTNANPKQAKHLETELIQLNIRRQKDLPVPTGVVCELWDKLRVNILTLVNLQQYVRDRETMRDDLRAHAATIPQSAPSAATSSTMQQTQPTSTMQSSPTPPIQRQVSMEQQQPQLQQPGMVPFNTILPFPPAAGVPNPAAMNPQAAAQAAAAQQAAAIKKKQEKRRLEGAESEQDDKRARLKK